MKQKMIEAENSDKYIFSDGKVLSMTCNYADNTIVLKLQIRKKVENQVVFCAVRLRFENVSKLDLLEYFETSGNYSDIVFVQQSDKLFYLSFDPFGNSGEPNESDNFIITAANCVIEEVQ